MRSNLSMELIVACDPSGVIGDGTTMLWHVPEDSKRFREMTTHHIVVMGRKTYEYLPICPLPNRINVVISRIPEPIIDETLNLYIANYHDTRNILRNLSAKYPAKRIFIIGGSDIYDLFFYQCNIFHITMIYCCQIATEQKRVVFGYLDDLRENNDEYTCMYHGDVNESRVSPYRYQYFTYVKCAFVHCETKGE